jgi:nucleoside-diphosphate-sugar epimerase
MTTGCISINSDARIQRNFLSATDFCSIIRQLVERENLGGLDTLNIGAPQSHSLAEMANLVASDVATRTNKNVEVIELTKSKVADYTFDLNTVQLQNLNIKIEDNYLEEFQRLFVYLSERLLNDH